MVRSVWSMVFPLTVIVETLCLALAAASIVLPHRRVWPPRAEIRHILDKE
ncbi:MAG: hypothetical protein ACP5HS_14755 [Anaerolineae bacterium]